MLHTLRLCHRFGQGRFTDFPVELVKMIEGYAVEPVRKKVSKDLEVASRCFRRQCSLLDHADRRELMKIYIGWVGKDMLRPGQSSEPSDAELLDLVEEVAMCGYSPYLEELDEEPEHEENRDLWPSTVEEIFSKSNRSLFKERFGLDIWYSFVRLPHHQSSGSFPEFGYPQTTITYLTLPDSVSAGQSWAGNEEIEEPDGTRPVECNHYMHGFGVAVEICKRPSAEELNRFSKALKFLKLKVFAHSSQKQDPALTLGTPDGHTDSDTPHGSKESEKPHVSTKAGDGNGKDAVAMLIPRPTFLTRHFE
jgi:hypothetical protein